MSDDPIIRALKDAAEASAARRQAEEQARAPFDRVQSLRVQLQQNRDPSGTCGTAALLGVAELIGEFMRAARAAGWGDRFERLKTDRGPSWATALEIYRRCEEGDFSSAADLMAVCEKACQEAKSDEERCLYGGVTIVLKNTIPNAIVAEPAEAEAPDQNTAQQLTAALERCIQRLEEEPAILFTKEPAYVEGLNADEINRLAGRCIFEDMLEKDDGGMRAGRWLIVHRPDGPDEARWRIWDRNTAHEGLNPKKLERTVGYLRAWREWASRLDQHAPDGDRKAEDDPTTWPLIRIASDVPDLGKADTVPEF